MHQLVKLTTFNRKECYKLYEEWRKIQEIANYFHVHRNTITKILERAKIWDFSVHKSTREDYRSIRYWLRKLDVIEAKIKKKQERYWSIVRYEKEHAWELVHIDVKKLKNIKWQNPKKKRYLAWVIDDCTRVNYTEVLPDKKAKTLALFFKRAYARFLAKWVKIKGVLCDNGKEFTTHREQWKAHHIFTKTCEELWVVQKFTRVRRPQTNGKIERFWRTIDTELLSVTLFQSREQLESSLLSYVNRYNYARRHSAIAWTPMNKLHQLQLKV